MISNVSYKSNEVVMLDLGFSSEQGIRSLTGCHINLDRNPNRRQIMLPHLSVQSNKDYISLLLLLVHTDGYTHKYTRIHQEVDGWNIMDKIGLI